MKRPVPLGISDFKTVIEGNYAYIDKTLLIQELLDEKMNVILIPRMRRFGKTLNLSMLRYFFEKTPSDTSRLFHGLHIWKHERYRAFQGQFPVVFLSLKDVKHSCWEDAFSSFRRMMAVEFGRHEYLLEGDLLTKTEKQLYEQLRSESNEASLIEQSLLFLTQWLHRYHQKKVVLLIDEYDTPIHSAYLNKYYNQQILFIRNWLSGGLKDNASLERGVLTGILRIAKESVFSGLNNLRTFTVLDNQFQDKFGLLEDEVQGLLSEYQLSSSIEELRTWYDGYRVGSMAGIYNPWSVLNFVAEKGVFAPYWVNTSDNELLKQRISQGTDDFKADVEELMRGGIVKKTIPEGVVFSQIEQNPNAVWALFLFTGYLTLDEPPTYGTPACLRIPNTEVLELYQSMVLDWFQSSIQETKYRLLLLSLTSGDVDTFSQIFQEFLLSSVSVFDVSADEPEKLYHGFILGLLVALSDRYEVKSNRESGLGRYDVMLIPKNPENLGIVLEFKKIGPFEKSTLESAVKSALKQIEQKKYAQELRDRGVKKILALGLAFQGKQVLIRSKFV